VFSYENTARAKGYENIIGVDEAGRGPLAGPVVAAAVSLAPGWFLEEINDSKMLSPRVRAKLFPIIKKNSLGYGVGIVDVATIDRINILQAALLAMKYAVEAVPIKANLLLIDGNKPIDTEIDQWTIVKGDSLSYSIAAASILAKVTRDKIMEQYHKQFPHYAFDRHKGYGTSLHRNAIKEYGPCPIHRRTFRGVKEFV
jgi:ribonuclease HII|tara:strand:+ start:1297 stop:1893 length:597 start_codon:yes stop_codon:yes gene_type:complete